MLASGEKSISPRVFDQRATTATLARPPSMAAEPRSPESKRPTRNGSKRRGDVPRQKIPLVWVGLRSLRSERFPAMRWLQ
jgi:hypothetical protein